MKLKCLVVDDERVSRDLIFDFLDNLDEADFSVDSAECAKSAIELIDKNSYDIIFTDKNMPGIDEYSNEGGMELLKYVNTNLPDAQIIMVTGFGTIETAIEALKLGAFDYITKPLSLKDVKEVVNRVQEYITFLNPKNTIEIYTNLHNEILGLIENSNLNNDDQHKLLKSIDSKIDLFFKAQKNWEQVLIDQRDALANVSSYAEQLKNNIDENDKFFEIVKKIYLESNRRI